MSNTNYFQGASNCPIQNLHLTNPGCSRGLDEAFKHLHKSIAEDAAHNSAERHDAPKCHQDTRKAVQGEIHGWIKGGDDDAEPTKILHLTGPAGTGKTAIAGSIADTCDEEGLLAGSFFFASFTASETRRSKRYLVATLTYHLVFPLNDNHPLRCAILLAVQKDPSIFKRRLKDQFKFLLVKPFSNTQHQFDTSTLPKVFIIDGLDEAEAAHSRQPGRDAHEARLENEADQTEILDALLYATNNSTFPFRIIVASRPERVIETFFRDHANHVTRKVFLDDKYDPDLDISLFLKAKFVEIRRRYRLPPSWPSEPDIQGLVDNASGQFIYAATVIRFLQSGKLPNPKALLGRLLDRGTAKPGELGALAPLDLLYTRILESSPDPLLAVQWFWVINYVSEWEEGALFVKQLLEDDDGQAEYLLENLASLVSIPPIEDQSHSGYHFYHKSFLDFLSDRSRCGERLDCAFVAGERLLVEQCIKIVLNKSPTATTSESQKRTFLKEFVLFPWLDFMFRSPLSEELGRCDVGWWVHFMVTEVGEDSWDPSIGHSPTSWFLEIHQACPFGAPRDCLPYCKHWRSGTLRAFREWGRNVPNVVALFRAALRPANDLSESDYNTFARYFRARDVPWPSNLPATHSTRYSADEEYEITLDLLSAMFSCLPADWKDRLERSMIRCSFPWCGWTDIIEEIKGRLGIEVPDVPIVRHQDEDENCLNYYSSDSDSDNACTSDT